MYKQADDPPDRHEDDEPYDALQIANWFIKRAKRDNRILSVMSILKLSYIAHGTHLAKYDAPLFNNSIQAWQYGPVIVDIYMAFRKQRRKVTKPLEGKADVEVPSAVNDLLEYVWKKYGNIRPFRLSVMTHVEGGPWDIASDVGGWFAPIPDRLIRQHYLDVEANNG